VTREKKKKKVYQALGRYDAFGGVEALDAEQVARVTGNENSHVNCIASKF